MNRLIRTFSLALLAFGLSLSAQTRNQTTLRIGLWTLWHDRSVEVIPTDEATPALTVRSCPGCRPLALHHSATLRAEGAQILLAAPGVNLHAAQFELTPPFTLAAHGERLTISHPLHVSLASGELVLAVTLPVESYVERVVGSESGPADTPESLAALAVVVRSFALHTRHAHQGYDLCDSTHCQLLHWAGAHPRALASHAATLATAGETLWYHGHPAAAWFHQNCGGHTASPGEVWPKSLPMPWLTARTDPYCSASGVRQWSASFSRAEITQALAAAGLVQPGWKSLSVEMRSQSGRVLALRLLSDWFEVAEDGDRFLFNGRGSGHGVGLCQAGSAAMAADGRSRADILSQYFPGTVPADEASGRSWNRISADGFTFETLDSASASPLQAKLLNQLSRALAEARARSGLAPRLPINLRAFPTVEAFRAATLAPGFTAAFTEGSWIGTQPLGLLASRHLLDRIARHEFLHALLDQYSAPSAPLWLREGLVELWSRDALTSTAATAMVARRPFDPPSLDAALAHPRTEAESTAAHLQAVGLAQSLLQRHGRQQVLAWLQSPPKALPPP